ncbi:hypothetical protein [Rhodanobacter caeni]|jgi:hypothetical protein|uniref:Lipoprotein n=1 Tax=Rhodanobacter caeni TaxID=657654 RepID=A0ABN0U9G1_9GAMM
MNFRQRLSVILLCLFSCACSAGEPSTAKGHEQTTTGGDAVAQQNAMASTTCAAGDQVVFSCPLAKGTKIASVCATQGKSGAATTFYYAFGHAGAAEFRFPAPGHGDKATFSRTHLGFAGNTGGYAYSFANAGYKYIVYAISGEGSSRDGGVIVQPLDHSKPATKLACRATAITETSDDQLIDTTLELKKDPQIESSGLPESR